MTEGSEPVEGVQVPPPRALHEYFRPLDDFASSRPCRDAYLGDLLEARGWSDRERTEYEQGQSTLWRLIPPITLEELEEADFDPPAYISLALAVTLWGRHALHFWDGRMTGKRMPDPLSDIERLSRHIAEQLEQAGRKSARGGIGRLDALRQDLQAVRLALEAAARDQSTAADGVVDGIATARKEEQITGLLAWLPRRLRRSTAPGMETLRRITEPGMAVSVVTGEFSMGPDWDVDPQVPPPLGVYDYVQALGDLAADKRLQHVFLHGLIQTVGLSEPMRSAFEEGRNGLWILIPPITATAVAEANLSADAARALGVALYLRVEHALLHYRPEQTSGKVPPVLAECGEILTVIKLALDSDRGKEDDPVATALYDLAVRLGGRGISAGGVVDLKLAGIREVRRQDAEARRDAQADAEDYDLQGAAVRTNLNFSLVRGASWTRVIVGAVLLVGLIGLSVWTNSSRETLPAASSYKSVPAVAIIRHRDEIVVRVPPTWMGRPQGEREGSLRSLYAHFAEELGPEAVPVIIVSLSNEPYGGVAGERVWWNAVAEEEPTEPAEPEGTPTAG